MQIIVSSYSFSHLFKDGFTQFDTIAKARELGFDGIEFSGLDVPAGESKENYASRLRDECARCGLPVAAYLTFANLLQGKEEIARVKEEADIAALLGAKLLRHDASFGWTQGAEKDAAGWTRTFAAALPILADGCREITEYAAESGIKTMVENHGFFCQDSARVEQLYDKVGHANFGLLFDMGNFMCADEDPAAAARIANLAFHVHAKDFLWKSGEQEKPGDGWFNTRAGHWLRGTVLGHGAVPVATIMRKLKANGYSGAVTVEFEGQEEVIPALRSGLAYLQRFTA